MGLPIKKSMARPNEESIDLPTSVPRLVGEGGLERLNVPMDETASASAVERAGEKATAAEPASDPSRVPSPRRTRTRRRRKAPLSGLRRAFGGALQLVGGVVLAGPKLPLGKHVVAAAIGGATVLTLVRVARNARRNGKPSRAKRTKEKEEEAKSEATAEPPSTTSGSPGDGTEQRALAPAPVRTSLPNGGGGTVVSRPPHPVFKGSTWGRVFLFAVVLVSLLEMVRQVDPTEFGLKVKLDQGNYRKYLVLGEKIFCLLLAWYLTIWISLVSSYGVAPSAVGSPSSSAAAPSAPPQARVQAPAAAPSAGVPEGGSPNFTGVWLRDRKNSDSLAGVCRLAKVNAILSKAICLVRGSELKQTAEGLSIRVFSEIPWFSLREQYCFGSVSLNKRRDFRRGTMACTMERTKTGLYFRMDWPEPYGGCEETYYVLVGFHALHVKTKNTITQKDGNPESISYTTIYHRKH